MVTMTLEHPKVIPNLQSISSLPMPPKHQATRRKIEIGSHRFSHSRMSQHRDLSEYYPDPPSYGKVLPTVQRSDWPPVFAQSNQIVVEKLSNIDRRFQFQSPHNTRNKLWRHRIEFRHSRRGMTAQDAQTANGFSRNKTSIIDQSPDEKTESKESLEKNLAQRIEERLWQYSSAGGWRRWILEVISWLVSASCFASVMIILLVYQDKRSPSWPISQTLNLLSRVASAALILPVSEALGQLKWNWFQKSKKMWDFEIFDNASRGPWGSALLLIRTKGR